MHATIDVDITNEKTYYTIYDGGREVWSAYTRFSTEPGEIAGIDDEIRRKFFDIVVRKNDLVRQYAPSEITPGVLMHIYKERMI